MPSKHITRLDAASVHQRELETSALNPSKLQNTNQKKSHLLQHRTLKFCHLLPMCIPLFVALLTNPCGELLTILSCKFLCFWNNAKHHSPFFSYIHSCSPIFSPFQIIENLLNIMFLVLLEGGQVKTTVIIVVWLKMGSTFMKYEKQFWYTYVFQIVKLNMFFK